MINNQFYEDFAADWIAAWNSHDIERILSHYDSAFEFSSPTLAQFIPESGGKLKGIAAARSYWDKGLALLPELRFEPITLLKGVDSCVIYYKGHSGKLCAEFFEFASHGKVIVSHAHGA